MAAKIIDRMTNVRTLKLAHGVATTLHEVVVNNGLLLIALGVYLSSDTGVFAYFGKIDMEKKAALALVPGDKVYWDATAEEITDVEAGNTRAGFVVEAVAGSGTRVKILMVPNSGADENQFIAVPLKDFVANTTVLQGCFPVNKAMRIVNIWVAALVVPIDADGDHTLAITNYDLSATTDDNLLVAATFDMESLTAKNSEALALTATSADLILAAGDMVHAALVNNTGAIDTDMVGGTLLFEIEA